MVSQASSRLLSSQFSAVSSEDEGAYIEPNSMWDLAKLVVCSVVSYTFSLIYLTILMVLALIDYYRGSKPQPAFVDDSEELKFDLAYYVRLQGYDLEEYSATTEDGFHLEMHRIIVPGEDAQTASKRYPVLLLHGLLQSSAAYCTSGENSLGFHLVANGYDVWLGNNRCGFEPNHMFHGRTNPRMWAWRLGEMGKFDLPCMVNRILEKRPEHQKIALVGHSQGTSLAFLALAKDCAPELGQKLSSFCALSPAVYTGPLVNRWFLGFIRYLPESVYRLLFGYHGYMSIMMTMHWLMPPKMYSHMGFIMFQYMFAWDDSLWDRRFRDRQLLFSPVHVSAELMFWWLGKGGFAARGCLFRHESEEHSWFNEQFPPLLLVVPGKDNLVDPYRLISRIKKTEEASMQRVDICEIPEYSHLDVLWATNVVERIGHPLVRFIGDTKD